MFFKFQALAPTDMGIFFQGGLGEAKVRAAWKY